MNKADPQILSLQELQLGIKDAIQLNFSDYLWVHAELSEVNIARNGHCYLELIEKDKDKVVAKVRATIWNFTFRMLKPYFESSTGYAFSSGIKVSLKVAVEFHEIYGLSLNVKDIDPNYTVGDIELGKRRILNRLEEDGILDMNTELSFPLVVQNIAVISSSTAAGYGDFENQLQQNPHAYKINYRLFEAQMQGSATGQSIISALDKIYRKEDEFDAVIIIRGGGSKSDLAGFDHYELAANIAQFPLPIITGIGHERDESIADIVAHTPLKTPTAVAEFLINQMLNFENKIDILASQIVNTAQLFLEEQSNDLEIAVHSLQQNSKYHLQKNKDNLLFSTKLLLKETLNYSLFADEKLKYLTEKVKYESKRIIRRKGEVIANKQLQLKNSPQRIIQRQERFLNQMEKLNQAFNPTHILERGFAMIEQNNRIITSIKAIQNEPNLKIIMKDGAINLPSQ